MLCRLINTNDKMSSIRPVARKNLERGQGGPVILPLPGNRPSSPPTPHVAAAVQGAGGKTTFAAQVSGGWRGGGAASPCSGMGCWQGAPQQVDRGPSAGCLHAGPAGWHKQRAKRPLSCAPPASDLSSEFATGRGSVGTMVAGGETSGVGRSEREGVSPPPTSAAGGGIVVWGSASSEGGTTPSTPLVRACAQC